MLMAKSREISFKSLLHYKGTVVLKIILTQYKSHLNEFRFTLHFIVLIGFHVSGAKIGTKIQ